MSENTKLNNILEQGEVIRWSGVPQPYGLFDESRKKATLTTLCWALVWGVFLVGGYYALSVSKEAEIKTGVMIFCSIVPLFIVWRPISDRNKVKKLSYVVTNKRAIAVSQEDSKPISMPLTAIDAVHMDKGDNGNCHVRVGSSVLKASSGKLPDLAYRGDFTSQGGDKTYKGLVFFNVSAEDGKTIHSLLKPATPLTNE